MNSINNIHVDEYCFFPVSVGNHWYSEENITRAIQALLERGIGIRLVIADDLYLWSLLARSKLDGEVFSSSLVARVLQLREDFSCFLHKIARRYPIEVWSWRDIWAIDSFKNFQKQYIAWVADTQTVSKKLDACAAEEAIKRGVHIKLQRAYILEEAAVSVYMNTKICNGVEIYPGDDNEFIRYLHEEMNDGISKLLNIEKINRMYLDARTLI